MPASGPGRGRIEGIRHTIDVVRVGDGWLQNERADPVPRGLNQVVAPRLLVLSLAVGEAESFFDDLARRRVDRLLPSNVHHGAAWSGGEAGRDWEADRNKHSDNGDRTRPCVLRHRPVLRRSRRATDLRGG